MVSASEKAKRDELHECLRKLDQDGKGTISVHLVAEAMRRIGIHFSFDDLAKELLKNDADGDGNMEIHEVDQFLAQEAALQRFGLEGALVPWSLGRSLALGLAIQGFGLRVSLVGPRARWGHSSQVLWPPRLPRAAPAEASRAHPGCRTTQKLLF